MTPLKGLTWVYHRYYEPWKEGKYILVVLVIWGKAATAQDTTATALVTEARVHLHANPSDASGVIKTLPTRVVLACEHQRAN